MNYKNLDKHFEALHNNPPKPFNPDYDPMAKTWSSMVVQSMEKDGFYDNHTREECSIEYRKRFDQFKLQGNR